MYRILMLAIFLLLTVARPGTSAALTPKEELGKLLFFDTHLSREKNQSCATCHQPPGFADPINAAMPKTEVASRGSVNGLFGVRNAPTVAYAAFSPHFHWDREEGLFLGGQFWDGREPTLKGQAKGPFLNPVDYASRWCGRRGVPVSWQPAIQTLYRAVPAGVRGGDC